MGTTTPRLTIHRVETPGAAPDFAADVCAGLTARPKILQPKYFYDEMGSLLFEAITVLDEYYPTGAELEILEQQYGAIVGAIPGPLRMIELGSGSATKTRILIDAILQRQNSLEYIPIDISETALENSSEELLTSFPRLRITAFASDYVKALSRLASEHEADDNMRTLALFLGGTIGNLNPPQAHQLLTNIRRMLDAGDNLLLGTDLKKAEEVLIAAYDDSLGVTAAFNLNLLARINRELGGRFDTRLFQHRAIWNEEAGRIEMHLVSRIEQTVAIRDLGIEVEFEKGESIHTENSYKFDRKQLAEMAEAADFQLDNTWYDSQKRFGLSLFTAR